MGALTIARAIRTGALISAAAVVANAMPADVRHLDHAGPAVTNAASTALNDAISGVPIGLSIKQPACRDRAPEGVQPSADEVIEVQSAPPAQLRDEGSTEREPRLRATVASVEVKQGRALPRSGQVEQGRSQQAEIQLLVVTIKLTVDTHGPEDDEQLVPAPACGAIIETRL
jgi:hypothetical protein